MTPTLPQQIDADDDGILAGEDCDDHNAEVGGATAWYPDEDGDGFGDSNAAPTQACTNPNGTVSNAADCNDADSNTNPGAVEQCNGADANCNGISLHAGQAAFLARDGTYTDLSHLALGTASTPSSYTTPTDGTLYVCQGLWYVNLTLAHNVDMIGPDSSAQTLLDGSDHGAVVTVNAPQGQVNVTLRGLTLRNGTATNGGGLSIKNAHVQASDLDITDNYASVTGGGIYVNALSTLEMVDSQVRDNVGEDEGGGIYCTGGEVYIESSSLFSNLTREEYSGQGGGAILMIDGDLWLDSVHVSENKTQRAGGAISLNASRLNVITSVFDNNHAYGGTGGAINGLADSSIVVSGSEFALNSASSYGGALHAEKGSSLTISDTLVNQNGANLGGGIAALDAPPVLLDTVTFTSNTATDSGGAYYSSATRTTGVNLVVSGNRSKEDYSPHGGGGIYCTGETLELIEAQLVTNSSPESGGGIYLASCDLSMTHGTLQDNDAQYGGGIFAGNASVVTLEGTQLTLNSATSSGGGIHMTGGSILTTWGNVRVEGNVGKASGGGLYADDHSILTLTDTTFKSNSTNSDGGGLYMNQGTLTATRVSFEDNESLYYTNYPSLDNGGGGLVAKSSTVVLTEVDFLGNSAVLYGGGATFNASTVTWSDSLVNLNTAGIDGAGALFMGNSKVALDGLIVTENVATDDGGGLMFSGISSKATLNNCDIQSNSATDSDGGLFMDKSWVKMVGGNIQNNRAAKGGGGIGAYNLSVSLYLDVSGTCFSGNKTNQVYNGTTAKPYEAGCPATFSCDNQGCQ